MTRRAVGAWLAALACTPAAPGQLQSINPAVREVVEAVSEERIAESLRKLESFGTRNTQSSLTDPQHGIGAARQWIADEFRSYSPRLQVSFDSYRVKKQTRLTRDAEIANVVAVLPGTFNQDRRIVVSAHYDSMVLKGRTGEDSAPGATVPMDPDAMAPGVVDDGSGTAAVLELARVMSRRQFDKTVVFVAFAAEEQGLLGSSLYAAKARRESQQIEAVLNSDIIGSVLAGNGRAGNGVIRVYSEDPDDSPSREAARYVREIGERYVPSMNVELVFRADRWGRSGDHTPFNHEGFAAIRFTAPNENFSNQHTSTDTFANTSPAYTARVARVIASAATSLALAPKSPVAMEPIERGPRKGELTAMIGRGKSRYDAVLRWKNDSPEPDLAGYAVVIRSTTAAFWEREVFAGNVTEFTLPDVSIDNLTFGVKAVDRDGNESLVSAYVMTPRPKRAVKTY